MYSDYPSNSAPRQGRRYGPGDEVTCFVELSPDTDVTSQQNNNAQNGHGPAGWNGYNHGDRGISFAVNGECLGLAFPLYQSSVAAADKSMALFPHILVKNVSVLVNLSGQRPLHWPQGKPWTGVYKGCLPWQVRMSSRQPGTLLWLLGYFAWSVRMYQIRIDLSTIKWQGIPDT